jgi:two-component system response regulator AtoC
VFFQSGASVANLLTHVLSLQNKQNFVIFLNVVPLSAGSTRMITRRNTLTGLVILYVEDDAILSVCQEIEWHEAGHTVVLAKNGRLAWERLDTGEKFDLVVTDHNMPEMTGLKLLQEIRADVRFEELPVIVWSGNVMIKAEVEDLKGHFISKGGSPELVLKVINQFQG